MFNPDTNLAMALAKALQVILTSLKVVQVGYDLGQDGSEKPRGVFCLAKGRDALTVIK